MGRTKRKLFDLNEAIESLYKLLEEQPLLPFVIPVLLFLWAFEKWFFSLSNWVLLALAVWATIQYGSYQRRNIVEDLNKKWMQVTLQTSAVTPLEHCEWLNKLLLEVWSGYVNPKLSSLFASIVERRLKHRTSRLIEKIELQDFSLGSRPPLFGLHGTCWATSGDQRIMRLSFDWDTDDVNIMLLAKLAMPSMGTRIVVNNIHVKGDLLLMPILEGKAIVYSFVSTPEVRLGVAFGSSGSQSLPATELPGVSSWLVKIAIDTLNKRMVEPRRQCLALPTDDLRKKAVGGVLCVTVISASRLSGNGFKGNCSIKQINYPTDNYTEDNLDGKELQTFLEIELEELTRRTDARSGSCPKWDTTFNLILHDSAGIVRFHLYQRNPGSVKHDYLTSCEIKMRYVPDDSTIFWAIGPNSTVIAKHAEFCGKEIEMTVPFEGVNLGELTVRLVLKEWHFSDGLHSLTSFGSSSHQSLNGASNYFSRTGRKISITVVEGKDLVVKDKIGKSDPYVKLQYGKAIKRTKSVPRSSNTTWNQKFEFDEIGGGEYLKVKCYTEETFGDESIGSARVNLEGLVDGSVRDVYIPLEKVNSGELRVQIEATRVEDSESSRGSHASSTNGWIELVLIEARDLVAADLRGTSDPYVRVYYGNLKKSTKVMFKTLNPKWHQTLEFPDDGSPLALHVKDHNTLLPTSNIGDCVVEYQMLPPNQMADKWIPLQGVKRGEIHIQVTRKVPQLEKRQSIDSESSPSRVGLQISNQIKEMMLKLRSQVEDMDLEGVSKSLCELESLHEAEDEYMLQLRTEQMLLINKIDELGQEIFNSSSPLQRTATIP
ncbi:putative Ca2+-dependent phospholipid-binding protein [Handroanthus impetiginosus]|uniref:Putative Ca2+-dependent phospholipid-binding protein n=1 Tax=Handroanthus impetiginosus TaxID=429701 RepID=A0A2G9H7P8_9LAMI|nr:putative Ca2+-dependent phospholipid-binding protein [Handroanthus impetiginosus]